MKYVMFECKTKEVTRAVPIIFPDFMVHADADKFVKHWLLKEHDFTSVKATSAGFIDLDTLKVYGESESLKLKCNPDDGRTISSYPYAHGIL